MGLFLNPGNAAFQVALNSPIYVDKTELLAYTNSVINTENAYICNSRPRRFGKSMTANMLTAYYSKGCTSKTMFSDLKIGRNDHFNDHLNRYDVIRFDVQWCMMDSGNPDETVDYINKHLMIELKEVYPDISLDGIKTAYGAMARINAATGNKFIVIIDEWDVLIRDEASNEKIQTEYINFLRGMFKGILSTSYIALAYMTGILPVKKVMTQSALNNFTEFTMIDPRVFAKYIGFTEEEVKMLCHRYQSDFDKIKLWYDGYLLEDYQVYNPKAVVEVLTWNKFQSYWSDTGTYESIVPLISMNFDGLKTAVLTMLSGSSVKVRVKSFQNDLVSFSNKDDILTYLIHLGYLGYDQNTQMAFVPNEEIRQELTMAVETTKWNELIEFQQASADLLDATLDMKEKEVAEYIEKIHSEYTSVIQYHDENSLSSVLTIAYLGAMQYYFKPVRELPTGRGFADFVFVPKPEYRNVYPALVVELKWNQNAVTAVQQIKEKNYPQSIGHYTGDMLLVGINYDKKSKTHECHIEKYQK